ALLSLKSFTSLVSGAASLGMLSLRLLKRGMREVYNRIDPLYSRCPARKSRNICEARFEVKDFFEFFNRLPMGCRIVRCQSKDILELPFPALDFCASEF